MFEAGNPRQPVNFAPYEVSEMHTVLRPEERRELKRQHDAFCISPHPPPGPRASELMGDYIKHVPYSSDKRTFGKTGRGGLDREPLPPAQRSGC